MRPPVDPHNPYTLMQRRVYDAAAQRRLMLRNDNHSYHNDNPDYWSLLVGGTEKGWTDKVGLDFGCGTARNVLNLIDRFARFDGIDISPGLASQGEQRVRDAGWGPDRSIFHSCNGVDLSDLPDDEYHWLMSTITLQHIPVWDIRYSLMREFFRVMTPDGVLSIQMRCRRENIKKPRGSGYEANAWDAGGTNGDHDVIMEDPSYLTNDLIEIGFVDIEHTIRPGWWDDHADWVYTRARKPHVE